MSTAALRSYPEDTFVATHAQIRKLQEESAAAPDVFDGLGSDTRRIVDRIAKELDAIHKTTQQKTNGNRRQNGRSGQSRNRPRRNGDNTNRSSGSQSTRNDSVAPVRVGSSAPPVTTRNIRLAPNGGFGQGREMRDCRAGERGTDREGEGRVGAGGNRRCGGRGGRYGAGGDDGAAAQTRRFRKEFNLLMNSITGKNTGDIKARLVALVSNALKDTRTERPPRDTTESDGAPQPSSEEAFHTLLQHISSLFVECASIQAIYSGAYAAILKSVSEEVVWPPEVQASDGGGLVARVCAQVSSLDIGAVSKLNAKGYARFATHLHRQDILSRDMLENYMLRWTSALSAGECGDNTMAVCELLVHICLTLAEVPTLRVMWTDLVTTHVAPLWADGSTTNMRAKIRLWDVRDAYGC